MNNILHLRGQFKHQSNNSRPGPPRLPEKKTVSSEHLIKLKNELQLIMGYWQKDKRINGALVGVYYRDVIAKSNRIKGLLCKGSDDPNDSIRGSKFLEGDDIKHVFIYYVKLDVLKESLYQLETCIDIVNNEYNGEISCEHVKSLGENIRHYKNEKLAKTNFLKIIVDAYYVEKFGIDRNDEQTVETSIVTIYKTDIKTTELLSDLGIDMIEAKLINETTVRLDPDELKLLKEKAPYLIAMKTSDISKLTLEEVDKLDPRLIRIPSPDQEPTIGVIDTLFYEDVYFKEWVTYYRMVDEDISTDIRDCVHGTAVSSIIVDGPTINPGLDDGCGRFRVRHFGVSTKGRFSSFTIMKAIREIVAKNRDIKVWNLSLGSVLPINKNFISPEAATLDKIQCENDVIFVVAGTNKITDTPDKMRIGAPADSLNSIVVNAVDFNEKPVSYHRVGPVLSFFHKPDVSYYGGDFGQKIRVCTPHGEAFVAGTSYAAPWIARKMAYLIHNLGLSREVAKALLIDSAAGWNRKDDISHSIGYGVVPKRIEDIVQTPNDEIRFIMTGSADKYETYTYNMPIPVYNDKQPFYARATLCYFPNCVRDQGVDYTNTELDIHFGRVHEVKGKSTIKSINENKQANEGFNPLREGKARDLYRKWDNIKHINDVIKNSSRPLKVYGEGLWGLSIKVKERLRTKSGKGMQFGVVVTLKEMHGKNRIDDFIKSCMFRGWIVNQIDIDNRFDIYIKAEEEVLFEK